LVPGKCVQDWWVLQTPPTHWNALVRPGGFSDILEHECSVSIEALEVTDKICTALCTYIHVLSLCHLYPLLFTWRITNENFQKIPFLMQFMSQLYIWDMKLDPIVAFPMLPSHLCSPGSVLMPSLPFTVYLKNCKESFQKMPFLIQFMSQLYI
jgi:hypothetical protein